MIGAFRLNTISSSIAGASAGSYWLLWNTDSGRSTNITPGGFDVDSAGNIYVLDMYSSKLAKYNSSGVLQWQKYVSNPSATTSKGDNGLLVVSADGSRVYCQLQQSATSMSICQFNGTTGALIVKGINSSTTSIVVGNTVLIGSDTSVIVSYTINVAGTYRCIFKRYPITSGTMSTTAAQTLYELATGSGSLYDIRATYNPTGSTMAIGYNNYISKYSATTGISRSVTFSFSGDFDSVATDTATGTFIQRDNIIAKWTGVTMSTKSWEVTHTVFGIGGSHFYNRAMVTDVTDNIYSCYWNTTANKIIIYKLSSAGSLLWTKSISSPGVTEFDAMHMKYSNDSLYLAFRYGGTASGGMAILKIPTDGTLTKTFNNGFILVNETGSVSASSVFALTSNTPNTSSVTIGTTGSTFTIADASIPTVTLTAI